MSSPALRTKLYIPRVRADPGSVPGIWQPGSSQLRWGPTAKCTSVRPEKVRSPGFRSSRVLVHRLLDRLSRQGFLQLRRRHRQPRSRADQVQGVLAVVTQILRSVQARTVGHRTAAPVFNTIGIVGVGVAVVMSARSVWGDAATTYLLSDIAPVFVGLAGSAWLAHRAVR